MLVTELVGLPERRALHGVARTLTAHDRVLLPAIRAYRGRRITSRGASVLATFASPTDAVLCGMAIQDLLASRNDAASEGERLSLRLAVHLGETRFRRGRLVGAPVYLAHAVCRSVACGEVWLTRSVQLAMNNVEVAVEPLPPVALGADAEPILVYRARPSPDRIPDGGREVARAAVEASRLERALEPISDALASIEEGAAEGRVWATLRVACATAALVVLGIAEVLVRGALAGSALAASLPRRRKSASPRVDGRPSWLTAGLVWIRSRRAIPRAALIRPLW